MASEKKEEKFKKKFAFVNEAAKREFLALPKDLQYQFGNDLHAVQCGLRPYSDFKDISGSVGDGAIELIQNGSPAFRTVYCAKYLDTVYILHAFQKTTNGVDRQAMKTAAQRHQKMMEEVQAHKKAAKEAAPKGKK
jgi:phage-related protein